MANAHLSGTDPAAAQGADSTQGGFFSGPPSGKVTVSSLATAVATLFWTIAAHTFWQSMTTADLGIYVTTSAVFLTAVVGYVVPESVAFARHVIERAEVRGRKAVTPEDMMAQITELNREVKDLKAA